MNERYVALLQGINVGRRRIVMADLRDAFAGMGFSDARTLIASGNVVFSAPETAESLIQSLEAGLQDRFGFHVPVLLRSAGEIAAMIAAEPFADWPDSEAIKRYVYFLAVPEGSRLDLPVRVPNDYEVVSATPTEVFVIAHKTASGRYGPGLDKFKLPDKAVNTNRNWATVLKLAEAMAEDEGA